MTRGSLTPIFLLALALTSCDQSSGSATGSPSAQNPSSKDPAALVGSWKMPAGEFATQYFVFQTDGTGKALSVAGTRRAISNFTWRFVGDSLELAKDGKTSRVSIEYRGDTLAFFSEGLFGPSETDFTKTPEPNLTPADGDRPATMLGHWRRMIPSVSESYTGDSLTGRDTAWIPQLMNVSSDGLANVIDFEMGQSCDPDFDCKAITVPSDTLRYRWWTSGSDLYLQMRSYTMISDPDVTQDMGENGPVQVVGWSYTTDSLHLIAKFSPYSKQEYARVP